MGVGCFASIALWLALASWLSGSLVPLGLGFCYIAFLIAYRGLHSEWPLY